MSAVLEAALFDLDGVVRRFDPAHPGRVESAAGLAPGTLHRVAFEASALASATGGRSTFEQWRDGVADLLERDHGAADGRAVADRFFSLEDTSVDADVLDLVRRIRSAGHPVGLLTNATSRLPHELEHLHLTAEFDVVCNSWEVGVAKPDPAAFRLAAERIGAIGPAACFFTDDRAENVAAAATTGMTAHHFTGDAAALAVALAATGLLVP